MLKNLHIKIFAVCAAIVFWLFVVSIENTFFRFPQEVPIQIFNQAPELALASQLGTVRLTIRAQDANVLKTLSINDFEAYVDLRNIGAGVRRVPVSVSSKNPQISIVSAAPSEIEITLEPVRQKAVALTAEISGEPANGFRVSGNRLSKNTISVEGAESVLKQIASAKAQVNLDGNERQNVTKPTTVIVYDRAGAPLEGVKIDDNEIEIFLTIVEVESAKQIGIRPKITGAVSNGTVRNIQVDPAVVSIIGMREVLDRIEFLETEPVDLKDVSGNILEKTVRIVLPEEISLAQGEKNEVKVRVEIGS